MLWITALMIKRYADANPQWVGSKSYRQLLVYIRQHSVLNASTHLKAKHKSQIKKRSVNNRRSRSTLKTENNLTSCRINSLEKEIDCIRKRIVKVKCERDSLAIDLAKITAALKQHK